MDVLSPPAVNRLSFKHLKAPFPKKSHSVSTNFKHYRFNTVVIYCSSIALDCRCSCYCVHFPVCRSKSVCKQVFGWVHPPVSPSFANWNWWCNEIVSAATLVSRTTLISAIQLFSFSSVKSSWQSHEQKACLFRVGYLVNCERKRGEELKPPATIWNLEVCVCLCVRVFCCFFSFCCSSWGLIATSQPTSQAVR